MRKGKDLLDRAVLSFETGRRLARVRDLVTTTQQNQVAALLVEEGRLFSAPTVIPWNAIKSVGPDAIIVPNGKALMKASSLPEIQKMLRNEKVITGTRVLTESGRYLGTIQDIFVDEQSGAIVGYEVSGGFWADMGSGKSFMPAPKTISVGYDVSYIPDDVALEMEQQVGGLQGAFNQADSKLTTWNGKLVDKFGDADSKVTAWNDRLVGKLGEADAKVTSLNNKLVTNIGNADQSLTQRNLEAQRNLVIGKPAQREVRSNGTIIVREGETITQQEWDEAERLGKLGALTSAALGGALATAASSAWGDLASDTRAKVALNTDQKRAYAIGRMAQMDVLDNQGMPLAEAGQVITEDAARRALDEGRLDELYRAAGGREPESIGGQLSDQVSATGRQFGEMGLDAVRGRRAANPVMANGQLILQEGQIVDDAVIRRAKETGTVGEVIRSASLGTARDVTGQASETASYIWSDIKRAWRNMSDGINQRAAEDDQRARERQARKALGRPVTRVILDRNDNVILDVGDLVTNRALEAARQSDVLDILIDSVYQGKVELSTEDLKAGRHGQASLERLVERPSAEREMPTQASQRQAAPPTPRPEPGGANATRATATPELERQS